MIHGLSPSLLIDFKTVLLQCTISTQMIRFFWDLMYYRLIGTVFIGLWCKDKPGTCQMNDMLCCLVECQRENRQLFTHQKKVIQFLHHKNYIEWASDPCWHSELGLWYYWYPPHVLLRRILSVETLCSHWIYSEFDSQSPCFRMTRMTWSHWNYIQGKKKSPEKTSKQKTPKHSTLLDLYS